LISSILYSFKKTIHLGENQAAISRIKELSSKLSKRTLSNNFVFASITVEKLSADIFFQYLLSKKSESNQSHLYFKLCFVIHDASHK